MWIAIILGISVPIMVALIPVVIVLLAKRNRRKTQKNGEVALRGIEAGICEQLHNAWPGSKWRWVCYPIDFALNGGIARIEVVCTDGRQHFVDVCLSVNGFMTLHVSGAIDFTSADTFSKPAEASPIIAVAPKSSALSASGTQPHDEETVGKWYNIVLIGTLTNLIDNLNASGEVCLHIGADGKAYTENGGNIATVYEFGEMPDVSLWIHISERLATAGLFAEIQNDNCIFISWA